MKLTVYGESDREQTPTAFECIMISCDMCYEAKGKNNFLSERKNSFEQVGTHQRTPCPIFPISAPSQTPPFPEPSPAGHQPLFKTSEASALTGLFVLA